MSRQLRRFLLAVIGLLYSLHAHCIADEAPIVADRDAPHYRWGRGLVLPALNLTIGGYTAISYKQFETSPAVGAVDDLSLFLTWTPHDRIRFFSELELENAVFASEARRENPFFSLERLYLDILASEQATLRIGKSLTPVGRWNVIHAAPLVWTTSRPLVTESITFPSHTTGAMVSGYASFGEQEFDITLYADDSADLDPKKEPVTLSNGFGGRIVYHPLDTLEIGASYLNFRGRAGPVTLPTSHLFGLDLFWTDGTFELESEMIYRLGEGERDAKGLYVQGVAPLVGQLFAVGRYEYFDGPAAQDEGMRSIHTNLGITGLAWRPYPPFVIKAEYRFGANNRFVAPSGFFTSIALFF